MDDMSKVIIPKSDQLNADDLLSGPKTIKVTGVTIKGGSEQPISINFEGDNGKPYKPCKSMCRVLVSAWGADSSKYAGRSMILFADPKVRWAGMEVGGIRISHMSDISETLTMALTVTRGNKKPYIINPLVNKEPTQAPVVIGQKVADIFNGTIVQNGEIKSEKLDPRIDAMRELMEIRSKYHDKLPNNTKTIIDRDTADNNITLDRINLLISKSKEMLEKSGVIL